MQVQASEGDSNGLLPLPRLCGIPAPHLGRASLQLLYQLPPYMTHSGTSQPLAQKWKSFFVCNLVFALCKEVVRRLGLAGHKAKQPPVCVVYSHVLHMNSQRHASVQRGVT